MTKGCYNVLHNEEKTELIFEIKSEVTGDVPDDQQSLVIDIGNALLTISLLYGSKTSEFIKALTSYFT